MGQAFDALDHFEGSFMKFHGSFGFGIAATAMILLSACAGGMGATGPSGLAGSSGHVSLVKDSAEPAGANCAEGGLKIESGVDLDDDGQLAASEVTQTGYACNGDGKTSLVSIIAEPAGANCAAGGYKVDLGVDLDGNGSLEASEIRETQYVCDGQPGVSAIVVMTPEAAGANCAAGGVRIDSGEDADRNGVLDPSEATTVFVCNGSSGHNSLINQIPLAYGSSACPYGGVTLQSGVDLDDDGILEATEVTASSYLCQPSPSCDFPRYANRSVGCPRDVSAIASGISVNGAFMAVTDSGKIHLLNDSGGGGNTTMIQIDDSGTVINPFWTSNLGAVGVGGIQSLGETLYVGQYQTGANGSGTNFVGSVTSTSGSPYVADYAAPRNGTVETGVAVFDPSQVYFSRYDGAGGFTIEEVTGASSSSTVLSSSGSAFHADRSNHRIYFANGALVKYLDLASGSSGVAQTAFTLPEGSVSALTTDATGRVYAGCVVRDINGMPSPCPGGSVYRANADGTSLGVITDGSLTVFALDHRASTNTLYLMVTEPSVSGYAIERLDLY